MKKNVDLAKSITDDWRTPSYLYLAFMENGYIDPCPYKSMINGLDVDYHFEKLFINPPYSDISTWVDYAIKQYNNGCNIVLLIPARTDTKYFHRLLKLCPIIYFISGRLHFNDSKGVAPFPSIIVELVHGTPLANLWLSCDIKSYVDTLL